MELYATVQAKNIVQLMCSGLDHTPVLLLVDNCNGSMEEENGARQDTQRLHSQHGENEKRVFWRITLCAGATFCIVAAKCTHNSWEKAAPELTTPALCLKQKIGKRKCKKRSTMVWETAPKRLETLKATGMEKVEATGQNKNHLQLLRNNGSTADNTCALVVGGNGYGEVGIGSGETHAEKLGEKSSEHNETSPFCQEGSGKRQHKN
ncbi:hypothetical protein T4D_7723 [Trichinella pseudospiralis]|uniref:Uncharacterized protein n=1 Tax=Trichinella pseudospiralis TaxID=6337 RepID=A0A0V1F564_TRIPS|nr:hypothetical protein T4D_7723 [Trichinella pseudospiralis]